MLDLTLLSDEFKLDLGERVTIAGFSLVNEIGSGSEEVMSTHLKGTISERWPTRAFVDTGAVHSEMGMCGGPVVLVSNKNVCVGMLEGLVPLRQSGAVDEDEVHTRLQGRSVIILATELHNFLSDIEEFGPTR